MKFVLNNNVSNFNLFELFIIKYEILLQILLYKVSIIKKKVTNEKFNLLKTGLLLLSRSQLDYYVTNACVT